MSVDPTSEQLAGFAARIDETPAIEEPEAVDTPTEEPEGFYLGTYRDREAAEQGLAEKERMIGELGNRAGEAERRLAELEQQFQYQQQYQQPQPQPAADDGPPSLTQAEVLQVNQSIQSLKMEGRTDEALELQLNLNEVLHQRTLYEQEQKFEQRIARLETPLQNMTRETAAKSVVEGAKQLLGENADALLHEHRAEVVKVIEAFPRLFEGDSQGNLSPEANRILAQHILGAEAMRQRNPGQPRNEQGQFIPVQGGSTAEPTPETTPQPDTLEPGDPRLAFRQQPQKDAFGQIPVFPGQ